MLFLYLPFVLLDGFLACIEETTASVWPEQRCEVAREPTIILLQEAANG